MVRRLVFICEHSEYCQPKGEGNDNVDDEQCVSHGLTLFLCSISAVMALMRGKCLRMNRMPRRL